MNQLKIPSLHPSFPNILPASGRHLDQSWMKIHWKVPDREFPEAREMPRNAQKFPELPLILRHVDEWKMPLQFLAFPPFLPWG